VTASLNLAKSSKKKSAADKPSRKVAVSVSVTNLTDVKLPRVPFSAFAEKIFRAPYTLSIAVIPARRAKVLNATYRNKTYSPNVLSFPLTPHEGEIILNITEARRQFDSGIVEGTWRQWVALLVIHSMLHLNGLRHGRTMERQLAKILTDFGLEARLLVSAPTHGTTHHHRH